MLDRTAYYCRRYNIPVSRQTTLSHAEVEKNLGIKQRNKWDFMILPGMTRVEDPVVIGDELRRRLALKLKALDAPPVLTAPTSFAGIILALSAALRRIFGKG